MFTIKFYNFNKINLINILISLIPLSLILGNLATNINIVLISLLGLLIYKKEIFKLSYKLHTSCLIYIFFIYLIVITFINNYSFLEENHLYKSHIFKSIFYLRFLFFFLIINKLIENEKFDIKTFFISCSIFSFIISVDIIIQFFLKKNILGFAIINGRPSSFFGEENIAGGFLQKFTLVSIFYLALIKKNKINKNNYILLLSSLFLFPIIFTGNRMSMLIYIMSILLFFILEKKFKKILISFSFAFTIIFLLIQFPLSERLSNDLKSFYKDSINIIKEAPELFLYNKKNSIENWGSGYLTHFNTGVQIWKQKKLFGHGLKSFRLNCSYENNQTCNTHPHNYFIEILVDQGVLGILIIFTLIISGTVKFLKYYYSTEKINDRLIASVFFILIFFEFFPLRSSGSFFTTNNSAFIFLILPIFLNLEKLKSYK